MRRWRGGFGGATLVASFRLGAGITDQAEAEGLTLHSPQERSRSAEDEPLTLHPWLDTRPKAEPVLERGVPS
jgi:hypothetical protein